MNRFSFLESVCVTFFLKSIYETFQTHYEIMRGPSHAPETTCEHSTEPVCLRSSAPTDSQSHATTPLLSHELANLHLHEPESATTPLRSHELADLHPHTTTPLYPYETTCFQSSTLLCSILLKPVIAMLKKAMPNKSIDLFNHTPLLHVCERMDINNNMSLQTVQEILLTYMARDLNDCNNICRLLVKKFVINLRDFSARQSEDTLKALITKMEILDVIYSIEVDKKLKYQSLSLVNGKVYINYGLHNSPSVPIITLRHRLYPNDTPMFVIIK